MQMQGGVRRQHMTAASHTHTARGLLLRCLPFIARADGVKAQ